MTDSKRLEVLKRDFENMYQRSLDKDELLKREIEGYSKIFDENRLILPAPSKDDEPLVEYDIAYSSMEIYLIRQFYIHFIVKGSDISEIEKDEWNSWVRDMYEYASDNLTESFGQKEYYYLSRDLNEYLKFLQKRLKDSAKSLNEDDTIIDSLYLRLIFKKYRDDFTNETMDTWLKRFRKEQVELDPIIVESEAKPGTGRLKLIAILASLQKATNNVINFETFVKTNFGILGFESAKSRSKDKVDFKDVVKDCDKILKIMT